MDERNVTAVPKICSIMVLANRFPMVFKANTTTNTQIMTLTALLEVLLSMRFDLKKRVVSKHTLRRMEMVSKTLISSKDESLPAQTFS